MILPVKTCCELLQTRFVTVSPGDRDDSQRNCFLRELSKLIEAAADFLISSYNYRTLMAFRKAI